MAFPSMYQCHSAVWYGDAECTKYALDCITGMEMQPSRKDCILASLAYHFHLMHYYHASVLLTTTAITATPPGDLSAVLK